MQDALLVVRFHAAKALCNVGEWFVERGIELAGEGWIDVSFEANLEKPMPWWFHALTACSLFVIGLFVMAMMGGR